MSKKRVYTGYAVVTKDILDDKVYKEGRFGILLSEHSLEYCKRYCHKGYIVVRTYRLPRFRGFTVKWDYERTYWGKADKYSEFQYYQFGHLRIEWFTKYTCDFEREIIYETDR